jgi:hypothetical protein
MRKLYSMLIAIIALIGCASLALADPGTTWDRQIHDPSRFTTLNQFGNTAVLDNETGRVWERAPSTETFDWFAAHDHCNDLAVPVRGNGRKGWRLPAIQELMSLFDPDVPGLPADNPFIGVGVTGYWSASNDPRFLSEAQVTTFVEGVLLSRDKFLGFRAWCVRGGQGVNPFPTF